MSKREVICAGTLRVSVKIICQSLAPIFKPNLSARNEAIQKRARISTFLRPLPIMPENKRP
jgi:hypothetical protein